MSTFIDILPQQDIDHRRNILTVIRLRSSSANSDIETIKRKSGVVQINSGNGFKDIVTTLEIAFRSWTHLSTSRRTSGSESLEQMLTKYKEFDDVRQCMDYIRSHVSRSVVLLLFNEPIRNSTIVSEVRKFPNVEKVYRCLLNDELDEATMQLPFINESPESIRESNAAVNSRVQNLDVSGLMALAHLFFVELTLHISPTDNQMGIFLSYCALRHPISEEAKEEFKNTYVKEQALNWFTKPNSFLYRIVSRTCASLDFEALPKVTFFLRDLYEQLRELHVHQIRTGRLKADLLVYRGTKMTEVELNQFKKTGGLFVTRDFLSTSTTENATHGFAGVGSGDINGITVIICIRIDYMDVRGKPIAYLREISAVPDEDEVMLSMGMVLRVESCRTIGDGLNATYRIQMVRGEDETKLDRDPSEFLNLIQSGGLGLLTAANIFHPRANLYQPVNNEHPPPEPPNNQQSDIPVPNQSVDPRIVSTIVSSAISIQTITNLLMVLTMIGVVPLLLRAILEPRLARLPFKCSAIPSVRNPSPNYQVERLDISCSETLSNMTIILIVQRTLNETHAQQYQTFWNQSTNQTYTANSTEIIYKWYSLPGMHIVKESFPHFVEAQFYYNAGSTRASNSDTWNMWSQSIDGQFQHLEDTF